MPVSEVDVLDDTERGTGGFGSTGRCVNEARSADEGSPRNRRGRDLRRTERRDTA